MNLQFCIQFLIFDYLLSIWSGYTVVQGKHELRWLHLKNYKIHQWSCSPLCFLIQLSQHPHSPEQTPSSHDTQRRDASCIRVGTYSSCAASISNSINIGMCHSKLQPFWEFYRCNSLRLTFYSDVIHLPLWLVRSGCCC